MSPSAVFPGSPSFPLITGLRAALAAIYKRDADRGLVLKVVDFAATEKLKFPSSETKSSVSIKVYTPAVFHYIRTYFGVDEGRLIGELEGQRLFKESLTSGKSGSWFFFTGDGLTVVKTIRHDEALNLTRILPYLYDYLTSHTYSLIIPFFGLYRVRFDSKRPVYIVTMPNINRSPTPEQRIYDLKGSTVGRTSKSGVGKDLDFIQEQGYIEIKRKVRKELLQILMDDSEFLAGIKLIDYSLLIMRDATEEDTPVGGYLTPTDPCDRMLFKHSAFTVDENFDGSMRLCYKIVSDHAAFRICIIDYLTGYTAKKAAERGIKSIAYDKRGVSAAPPDFYAERFYEFMKRIFKVAERKQ